MPRPKFNQIVNLRLTEQAKMDAVRASLDKELALADVIRLALDEWLTKNGYSTKTK